MKIAFEAKRAYTNGTGLGHYSRTLLSSLAVNFPEHSYYLCTPRLTDRYNAAAFSNMQVVTPQRFPSRLFTSAWRSSWVKKDLKRLGIDLYHGLSHEIPMGIQHTGIKTVVTIHDLIFERYPGQFNAIDVKIYRKKFSYACAHADRVIAISQQTKDDIMHYYGTPAEKIDVCYQSCNPMFAGRVSEEERRVIRERYQLPERYYLYVGSVIERKNLLTICKAVKALQNDIPLVVIGDGDGYKKQVLQYIAENGLGDKILFLSDRAETKGLASFRSAEDFPAIYQQAICMIYPSIFEGFGIPVLEALFSQIPVITSNLSCLPEAGGPGAWYIDPYDVGQLAEGMRCFATDAVLCRERAAQGVAYAQNFTADKCAAAVMQVYLRTV
ncbi:glycosyltransferase family 4 protein [Filimonas effusa]|uniref:Glycosyltransferase family 1 protein n=1 Tax=Filimonas effusa TaxID=2508721 RepID=A0A4Q1D8T6_9BACT|nr:glycosyltransferase family 1 protein [Filimonas effusa]RXK85620.1 glycosyltransferase family 1 protein [Filimonas effusa]